MSQVSGTHLLVPLEGDTVSFCVHGEPRPAGSKKQMHHRSTGRIVTLDASGEKGARWREDVRLAARRAMGSREPFDCALRVTMIFQRQRPKAHLRANGDVKPSAPPAPITRPDALKLARQVEDSMTGIVYTDDSLTVDLFVHKIFGSPGVTVVVQPVHRP